MIPSAFVFLDALPGTPNGKTHRQALPEPLTTRPELDNRFVAPQNTVQTRLAQIWENVLGIHPIGIEDSFIDLGGDSLEYLSLLIQIEYEFGKTLPSTLQTPTIEQMAQVLEKTDPILTALPISDPSPSLWSFLRRGLSLLLFFAPRISGRCSASSDKISPAGSRIFQEPDSLLVGYSILKLHFATNIGSRRLYFDIQSSYFVKSYHW